MMLYMNSYTPPHLSIHLLAWTFSTYYDYIPGYAECILPMLLLFPVN